MDKENVTIPRVVYELNQAFQERREKRYVILIAALIVSLLVSNMAWLYTWMQYDYCYENTVSMDCADGNATFVGGDNVIYGEDNGN